jgi:hypothetical protein
MSLRLAIPLVTSLVTFSLLGCGSDAGQGTTTLRPGVEDSSQSYKGTPSAAESAFWEAVRNGDDTGREEAANKMRADAQRDPATYGYSAFLAGANSFMHPTVLLRAQADGTTLPQGQPRTPDQLADAEQLLTQGMQNLTDPLYLGFDAAFLATLQLGSGDVAAGQQSFALGMQKNPAASGFISVIFKLQQQTFLVRSMRSISSSSIARAVPSTTAAPAPARTSRARTRPRSCIANATAGITRLTERRASCFWSVTFTRSTATPRPPASTTRRRRRRRTFRPGLSRRCCSAGSTGRNRRPSARPPA